MKNYCLKWNISERDVRNIWGKWKFGKDKIREEKMSLVIIYGKWSTAAVSGDGINFHKSMSWYDLYRTSF